MYAASSLFLTHSPPNNTNKPYKGHTPKHNQCERNGSTRKGLNKSSKL